MQLPPFPAQVDNTIRSCFAGCERKAWLRFLNEWAPPLPSIHLHAGQAFARGLEVTRKVWYTGAAPTQDDAIAAGWEALIAEYGDFDSEHKPNKSAARMGEALVSYFEQYPLATDLLKPAMFNGAPAVEFRFGIPLPINNPSTGDPIIYTGRFDMLGEAEGHLYVVDEKTTGSLGQYWAKRYELSAQFTGYCWAAQQYGYPVVGAIIRGIGILKEDIKHAAMPLYRQDYHIQEWYTQLLKDVQKMVDNYCRMRDEGGNQWTIWEPDLADACGGYGGCDFLPVCGIMPEQREKLLEINFVKRAWNPLGDENE